MASELPKNYEPHEIQRQIDDLWKQHRSFHAEPDAPGEPYAIVIPPPNVTAALHLGHALNNTLQDILIRYHRMLGDNAVWLPGTDHAGIATQTVVEKRVLKEEGRKRTDFQRDEFVAKIQAWKDEYEQVILGQLRAMGSSCDWERTAFTMDEPRARAVREAFFQLFKDGLIYRGKRLVNWDPATQTALADDEVENEEIDGHFYYLRYPLSRTTGVSPVSDSAHGQDARGTEYITVATTRPETMLGDTAVAINPKDPRAAELRGRKVLLPIVNREIPIIEDDYVVLADPNSEDPKAKFASGFLKVTPAHDPNDWEIGLRHKLDVINVMAPDATISDKHGWSDMGDAEFLLGLDRYEARKAVVEWFRQNKLLEDVKPYRHSVGHSYRSHVPIEPYLSDQWYLKVTDDRLAGRALRALDPSQRSDSGTGFQPVSSDTGNPHGLETRATNILRFFPARYAKTYQTWNQNIRDWCISRQLWWGHRIPVWTGHRSQASDLFNTIQSGPAKSVYVSVINGAQLPFIESETDKDIVHICVFHGGDWVEMLLKQRGFHQDPDVLDTWFSSGLWPMSTLGWPEPSAIQNPKSAINKWNPTNVLCTAREIITLWVQRMVMFNLYFLDRLPFTDVFIHAMIQDGEGRKMSKSLGNGVDPLDIISSHGADAMRFVLTSMATNTQDVRMPVEKDAKTGKNTSPKFDLGRNFCNKLWNAARFVLSSIQLATEGTEDTEKKNKIEISSSVLSVSSVALSLSDRWIVSKLNRTIADCNAAIADYRFDQYAKACYDFFWRDFCDWYVEASKPAMKNPATRSQTADVLAGVLDASLRLMHPMIPYVTEALWSKLREIRPDESQPLIIRAAWPVAGAVDDSVEADFTQLQEIIGAIRNVRNDYKVDPKRPVAVSIQAPEVIAKRIRENQAAFEILAPCTLANLSAQLPEIKNAAKTTAAGCEIFIEGLVDESAERERGEKRKLELQKQIAAMKGRLSNEGYIAKAPPNLVQQTKDQLAQAEAELAKIN